MSFASPTHRDDRCSHSISLASYLTHPLPAHQNYKEAEATVRKAPALASSLASSPHFVPTRIVAQRTSCPVTTANRSTLGSRPDVSNAHVLYTRSCRHFIIFLFYPLLPHSYLCVPRGACRRRCVHTLPTAPALVISV